MRRWTPGHHPASLTVIGRALLGVIGREDLLDDEGLRGHPGRSARMEEVDALVSAWSAGLSKFEAASALQQAHVPAAAVRTVDEIAHDERQIERRAIQVDQSPRSWVTSPYMPARSDGTTANWPRWSPTDRSAPTTICCRRSRHQTKAPSDFSQPPSSASRSSGISHSVKISRMALTSCIASRVTQVKLADDAVGFFDGESSLDQSGYGLLANSCHRWVAACRRLPRWCRGRRSVGGSPGSTSIPQIVEL